MADAMDDLDRLIEAVEAGEFFGDLPRPAELHTDLCWKAFNGSLDAAKALHEALLPGWWWVRPDGAEYGTIRVVGPDNGDCYPSAVGKATAPARAWLLAILRAYRTAECATP